MQLEHLANWPPNPPPGYGAPRKREGVFRGCEFVPRTSIHQAYLMVSISFMNAIYTAFFWHPSERLLRSLQDSLSGHEGLTMLETGSLPLLIRS